MIHPSNQRRVLTVPEATFPSGVPLSPGIACGDFVFTSSCGATDWRSGAKPAGRLMEDPIKLETRQLYEKLAAILRAGGSGFERSVQINQWVNTYGNSHERHGPDRDEVGLFFEHWRSIVHPHLQTRNEYLIADRPASACMPVDRLMGADENVNVELVALSTDAALTKRAYEHDVHSPLGGYSIGIEAGSWLFTAGFTGVDFTQGIRPEAKVPDFIWYGNQIHNETRETLRQLKIAVEAGGGRMEDTIKATVYLTPFGMANLPALEEAWAAMWPDDPPARALIPCTGVGLRGTNVEIMLTVLRRGHGVERTIIRTAEAPRLGHAAQAVRAGDLLFLSTQLGLTPEGHHVADVMTDGSAPYLRRATLAEVVQIQRNVDAICRAAGTSISQAVKASLHFSDFGDLSTVLPQWGSVFTDGFPAGGFFEGPPGVQAVSGCRMTADVIASCPS